MKIRIVLITALALFSQIWGSGADGTIENVSELKDALKSPSWQNRMKAASEAENIKDENSQEIIRTLFISLESEIIHPDSTRMRDGSYIVPSSALKEQYILSIANLSTTDDSLLKIIADSTTILRDWAKIALGLIRPDHYRADLINFIEKTDDGEIRVMAIRALAKAQNKKDAPVFISALKDSYKIFMPIDHDKAGGDFLKEIYPARMEAINALTILGYKVKWDSSGGFNVEEKK